MREGSVLYKADSFFESDVGAVIYKDEMRSYNLENDYMAKNLELRSICKVADIIERLSERDQDLLLFKYQYNCSNDLIAELMGISEDKVEPAIDHAKLSIAAALLLTNSRPIDEDILKRAVTIAMYRQMDSIPEIESVEETYVTKPFDVFMQELEERYERRMRENK